MNNFFLIHDSKHLQCLILSIKAFRWTDIIHVCDCEQWWSIWTHVTCSTLQLTSGIYLHPSEIALDRFCETSKVSSWYYLLSNWNSIAIKYNEMLLYFRSLLSGHFQEAFSPFVPFTVAGGIRYQVWTGGPKGLAAVTLDRSKPEISTPQQLKTIVIVVFYAFPNKVVHWILLCSCYWS